jgi:hypothetical protein
VTASLDAAAVASLFDLGYLRIYGGTKPSAPSDPPSGPLLAELRFGSTAFAPADNGVCAANPISKCSDNPASGMPTWFRCERATGEPIVDGSVGTAGSGADLILERETIVQHAQTTCSRFNLGAQTGQP